jgi:hypothetical protein
MQKVVVKSKILHAVKTINQDNKKTLKKGIRLRFAEYNLSCVMQLLQKKTLTVFKVYNVVFFSS